METRSLQEKDIPQSAALDKHWFGEYGISEEDLHRFIQDNPDKSIGIFDKETLVGFATFEIIEHVMPKDYVGDGMPKAKTLFIQQFTTTTNYTIADSSADAALLSAIEQKALVLGCKEIWEALAIDHPYSKAKNPDFDAFGFYRSHGFVIDTNKQISWSPNKELSIPCYLFQKTISPVI
jgi:hypothetical protein